MSEARSIYIAGHRGMVGAALVRRLADRPDLRLVTATRRELDLTDQAQTHAFVGDQKPDVLVIAAAKVGGIHANSTYPADFIYDNLMIAANLVHAAFAHGVQRVLFLGSSCIYPRAAPQPMTEDCLLTSPLESTNEAYAIAKIAGLKLCQHYRAQHGVLFHSAMPTNLYGPGDNYHPENSHVIPALLRRFHEARELNSPCVTVWGTGLPRREFLHVDDLAAGCLHLLETEDPPDWVNIGYGEDVSIRELAETVATVVGYTGAIAFDTSKPDGTPRKLMDPTRMRALGWHPRIPLLEGLGDAYTDFLQATQSQTVRSA
ncbi:MAG: GDP-L-fucose synthase [Verrucomicrobiales bacterium]|nr:GDP-L-fucose synthase [Verrucomicrobiales bacterium]